MSEAVIMNLAQQWLNLDCNPSTRQEIQALIAENNITELSKRLTPRIAFGTAGLRSTMEAGFARMNDLTVIQASQGVASYFLQKKTTSNPSVVIGFDHRRRASNGLSSERFARLAAAVFLKKGFKVYMFKKVVHTPMVPYSVKQLKTSCGIMITASHNPKNDNGYKLYAGNGCLIIPPMDKDISTCIEQNLEPEVWDDTLIDASEIKDRVEDPSATLIPKYMATVKELTSILRPQSSSALKCVYTAMHGVAHPFIQEVFKTSNLDVELVTVEAQAEADPEFPTVAFPNPEEGKGALKLALEKAEQVGARYVFANDPDGDRFVAAQKLTTTAWHIFTGDQLGILFADFAREGFKLKYPESQLACLTTAVSSKMLSVWGQKQGVRVEETLTGFKWLSNRAEQIENEGAKVLFCYEEAIGFMLRPLTDKDGVSAAACFALLASKLNAQNSTVYDYLNELYREYGCFVSHNHYIVSPSPKCTADLFETLRKPSYPTQLGSYPVLSIRDLSLGYDSSTPDHSCPLPKDTTSNALALFLNVPSSSPEITFQPCRITLRASGTEPKIKYYIEMAASAASLSIDEVRSGTAEVLKKIAQLCLDEWLDLKKVA